MATTFPGKFDPKTGMLLEMRGVPAGRFDAAFDSYLIHHNNGQDNHTLTLVLKILLNKVSTFNLPLFPHLDASGELFLIKPWQSAEWLSFQNTFKRQCATWNNKFWLIPPNNFSKLDVKVGSRTIRPNIYCHLYIDLVTGGSAHRTIDVVNLSKPHAAAKYGIPESDLNSGDFGSHEGLYDSLDVTPRTNQGMDHVGQTHRHANYLTVVHEIGHALGLDHIGVLHGDPFCQAAIFMSQVPGLKQSSLPALFKNGSNAGACYGTLAPPSRYANVMGGGTAFEAVNAKPWLDRIALHTQTAAANWKVSMGQVAPKVL